MNDLGKCKGLNVLLERLSCVRDIQGEGRPLLGALVKLLSFCTKVATNRVLLIKPELGAVQRLLVALKLCLQVLLHIYYTTNVPHHYPLLSLPSLSPSSVTTN